MVMLIAWFLVVLSIFIGSFLEDYALRISVQISLVALGFYQLNSVIVKLRPNTSGTVIIPGEARPVPSKSAWPGLSAERARLTIVEKELEEKKALAQRTQTLLGRSEVELTRMQDSMRYLLHSLIEVTPAQADNFMKEVKSGSLPNQSVKAHINKCKGIVAEKRARRTAKNQRFIPGGRVIDLPSE